MAISSFQDEKYPEMQLDSVQFTSSCHFPFSPIFFTSFLMLYNSDMERDDLIEMMRHIVVALSDVIERKCRLGDQIAIRRTCIGNGQLICGWPCVGLATISSSPTWTSLERQLYFVFCWTQLFRGQTRPLFFFVVSLCVSVLHAITSPRSIRRSCGRYALQSKLSPQTPQCLAHMLSIKHAECVNVNVFIEQRLSPLSIPLAGSARHYNDTVLLQGAHFTMASSFP